MLGIAVFMAVMGFFLYRAIGNLHREDNKGY